MPERGPGYDSPSRDLARPISKLLKWGFAAAFLIPFILMIYLAAPNAKRVPPYPARVVSGGEVLTDKAAIMRGQHAYQEYGLMDQGSVWGHGSQRGMDFSAQSLHMMGREIREYLSRQHLSKPCSQLGLEDRAVIDALTIHDIKTNTYDPSTGDLTLPPAQAQAFRAIRSYWENLFAKGDSTNGVVANAVPTADERHDLGAFFYWTGWAAGTTRPGQDLTYTNNWPSDRTVGNTAPNDAIACSGG